MTPNVIRMISMTAVAVACTLAPLAHADDYTDAWWVGPAEDGWGVDLIQSQDVIFASLFVYGPAPATTPTWYVAVLSRAGNGSFTGPLYHTAGTGIGAPWNPADHPAPVQDGTATFTPTSAATGTLTYNVNATIVTKTIRRQTLTTIALGGSYYGTGVIDTTGCTNSGDNKRNVFDVDPVVTQTVGQMQIAMTLYGESCTLSGTLLQEGLLFSIPSARYVCTDGTSTTLDTSARVYEVKYTSVGLEGRWSAPSVPPGCREDGSFAAVFP
jgi:hypothetical protein